MIDRLVDICTEDVELDREPELVDDFVEEHRVRHALSPAFWDAQLSVTVADVRRERGECGKMHSVRGASDGKREG